MPLSNLKPLILILGSLVGLIQPVHSQQKFRIELGDFRFQPDRITVAPGAEIELELVNTDTLTPHDFVLKVPAAGMAIQHNVAPRKTETVTLTAPPAPGVYPFYCSKQLLFFKSHRQRGMEGQLIVIPPESQR